MYHPQAAKRRARRANKIIRQRWDDEVERIKKIDEVIRNGGKPPLNDESEDEFESDDDDDDDDDEDEDEAAKKINEQFNKKPTVVEQPVKKKKIKRQKSRFVLPERREDGSEGHPEPVRFKKTDIRVQVRFA